MADVDTRHRLVVLGSGKVGKSSIIRRFLNNTFTEKYRETVDDLFCRDYCVNGHHIKVDFLDTAGNYAFPAMRRLSISTAHAFLLVYAEDEASSLDEVKDIYEQIKEQRENYAELPLLIVGNKADVARTIDNAEVECWLEREGLHHKAIEVSARDNTGIIEIFQKLLDQANIPEAILLDSLLQKKRTLRQGPIGLNGNDGGLAKAQLPQRRKSAFGLPSFASNDAASNPSDDGIMSRSRSLIRRRGSTKVKVKASNQPFRNDCVIS